MLFTILSALRSSRIPSLTDARVHVGSSIVYWRQGPKCVTNVQELAPKT